MTRPEDLRSSFIICWVWLVIVLVFSGVKPPALSAEEAVRPEDMLRLIVQANAESLDQLAGALGLTLKTKGKFEAFDGDLALTEAVVPADSSLVGRSADETRVLGRNSVSVLGISRQGKAIHKQLRRTRIQAGDIVLLVGSPESTEQVVARTGLLPLAERGLQVTQQGRAWLSIGIFGL